MRVVTVRNERYRVPCGSRYCPACGERWAKDHRVRAVAAAKDLPGDCALITVTAPGDEVFGRTNRVGGLRKRARMRVWNADARERWTDLHRRASKEPRRQSREAGCDWRVLYRTWEFQKRGVLHNHLVLPYGTPDERAATELYVLSLWLWAREHGFGFVMGGGRDDEPGWDVPPPIEPADANRVAVYVSKYVTKASGQGGGMVAVARSTAMRGSVLYIAPHLLRESGVSMTSLRARRRIVGRYPWAKTSRRAWREACHVDAVQRGRPPLTQEAVRALREVAGRSVPMCVGQGGRWDVVRPTQAPEPPGLAGYAPRDPAGRIYSYVALASVLLRVPEPEDLGWVRTEVERIV